MNALNNIPGYVLNDQASIVETSKIPVLEYDSFYNQVSEALKDESAHCIAYYPVEIAGALKFLCFIAHDKSGSIKVFSFVSERNDSSVKSLTAENPQLHIFEREIHEKYGLEFTGHPWLKPVRYPYDRAFKSEEMKGYPFYFIDSEELHEVGVGPVHAGVIEPGHFRFICNGEKVLHLEIQLGYQHRGIENLFLVRRNPLQRAILSENIAGDTSVGHSLAHAQLIESLAGIETDDSLKIERCVALEMERIAVHVGDTAALCGDVAYQLGQVVCESIRTGIINTTQLWCGNRFGKGLVRPGGSNYPITGSVADSILKTIDDTEKRFGEICDRIYSLPSLLARFEDIGRVTKQQAYDIGAVGMAARSCGITRDIRISHPFQYYKSFSINPGILDSGDVLARGRLRVIEVMESIRIIRELVSVFRKTGGSARKPVYDYQLVPGRTAVSLVEGWRGEICHSAVTGIDGQVVQYKVKDPSFHNWMALAIAVRNQEISDFPVCNKSFNLSYCGNDL